MRANDSERLSDSYKILETINFFDSMKKILFIFLFCSVLFNVSAQSVQYRVHFEGSGIDIMTRYGDVDLPSFPYKRTVSYALQYRMEPNQEGYYFLNITLDLSDDDDRYIPEGARLLMKTKTGHVITLNNCGNIKTFDQYLGYFIDIRHRSSRQLVSDTRPVNLLSVRYLIAKEDLQRILNESIIKLRFETTGEEIDFEYEGKKADETAAVLKKLHGILYRELNLYHGMK